jgi:GxxExxY protein
MHGTLKHRELTFDIIGAAMEVHRRLGPGLLEGAYRLCLMRELELRGLQYTTEEPVAIEYKGIRVENAFRTDLIIEGLMVVELKCVEEILAVHEAQLLTYMKLRSLSIGLLHT